ncbi:MerR family transcriptional regulator [Azospirillum brasilense]|uniref:MerR family transcriptional regulator n=1 Tax=Azospirillum brasilense TaxID=192 RepID=A0A6L3B5K9_AZOBR|nr:MerR family transcriptional regulator [Azospirillum brasilense]
MTIGALSRRTGCNIETIRFYEKQGLVPAPPRTEGGHRVYGETHLRRLGFIRRSRDVGFTLDEVRALLRLADGHHTCAEVQALALEHLDSVRRTIADLQRLERTLSETADRCVGGDAPNCPVLETLFSDVSAWPRD